MGSVKGCKSTKSDGGNGFFFYVDCYPWMLMSGQSPSFPFFVGIGVPSESTSRKEVRGQAFTDTVLQISLTHAP